MQRLHLTAFSIQGLRSSDPEKLRIDLEQQLSEWSAREQSMLGREEQRLALAAWHKYEMLTSALSQDLCEQLRLVLEPSLATKLR